MKFLSLPTSHSINNALFSSSSSSSFPLLRRIFLTSFPRRRFDKSYLTFPPKRSFCNCSGNSGIGGRDFSSAGRGMGADQGYGEIHVIVGPMFAGKTTTLLRRIHDEKENGRIVAVIKSDKDIRYDERSIVTHDGVKMPCWPLSNLSSFKTVIGLEAYRKLEVIGIDEAQFFEDLYDFCQLAADNDGKTIIVAGLDGDYLRRNFGSILDIVPLADSVTKLKARCGLCGRHASFTLRKSRDTQTELIGGSDVYMPVCRQHYVKGQVVIETTRTILESQLIHESYIEAAPASS